MEIRGLIFDCDGTLVDSMPPHYEAWIETLARYQLALDEDRFYAMGGWPTLKVAETLIHESGRPIDAVKLAHEKEARFEELLDHVNPVGPVIKVVRENFGKRPLAVATGGTRAICERLLKQAGIFDCFDAIVTCEDVLRHKPAPDIFLEAARRLGLRPEHCQVYEDADPGVEAAKRAGMSYVDIRTFYKPRRISA